MNCTKVLIVLLLCTSFGSVRAQKFSYGIKAGVLGAFTNFADKGTRDTLKSGIKPGFSVGGFVMFPLKKNNTFIVEGGFSQQGRSWKYKVNGDSWSNTYYFADFSMALRKNFHLKVFKNIPTQWFVNFGPNINYWISGKGKMDPYFGIHQHYSMVFDKPSNSSYTTIYVNNENRWLYGINLGIGFNATTLRNQRVFAELRLTWGQTYLGQRKSENVGGVPQIQDEMSLKCNLKVLNLSVGYIFDRDLQKGKLGKSTKKLK